MMLFFGLSAHKFRLGSGMTLTSGAGVRIRVHRNHENPLLPFLITLLCVLCSVWIKSSFPMLPTSGLFELVKKVVPDLPLTKRLLSRRGFVSGALHALRPRSSPLWECGAACARACEILRWDESACSTRAWAAPYRLQGRFFTERYHHVGSCRRRDLDDTVQRDRA